MSGNIQNVNLQKLQQEITDYGNIATKLHNSLSHICTYFGNFKTCWTGQRINTVITLWNNNYKQIDDNAFYFAMKIELILKEIYYQYTAMEHGQPRDVGYGYGWGGIFSVPLTDATTITFEKAKAESLVKNITAEVNNVNVYLKELVSKLDSMQSYSDSLKTLATTYKSNANSISTSLNKLCNSIQSEATKAIQDVNITEQYNEKDAKRASTTGKQ